MYRTIDCATWGDSWFKRLPPDGKLVFLHLLTNHRTNVIGVYEIDSDQIAFETGVLIDRVETLLTKDLAARVVWWPDHCIVWVRNFFRRQWGEGGDKHRIAARRILSTMPKQVRETVWIGYPALSESMDTLSIPYADPIDTLPIPCPDIKRETVTVTETVTATATASPLPPVPANGEPPDPLPSAPKADRGKSSIYEQTLSKTAMAHLVQIYGSLDKQLTEGWVRMTLREIAPQVGPLPRDKLGRGLDLAADQIRRDLANGGIRNPRAFGKTLVLKYLTEQTDASFTPP